MNRRRTSSGRPAASSASIARVRADLSRYMANMNAQVAACTHSKTYDIEYRDTEHNGLAIEGGKLRRCAFSPCNALVEVLA